MNYIMPAAEVRRLAERFAPKPPQLDTADAYLEMRRSENRRCMKALREKRRANHECVICGAKLTRIHTGIVNCESCRDRNRTRKEINRLPK